MKALLVIDVQEEYIAKYDEGLLTRINQRIQQATENEELILYVMNVQKQRRSTKTYEFAEGLNICSSHIMYKEAASAFTNDEVRIVLNQNKVSEIEIIGMDGNYCVAGSAADAQKMGYNVILPCKYIGVKNSKQFEKKKLSFVEQGILVV